MAETGKKKVVVVKKHKTGLTDKQKEEAAKLKAFAQQNGDAIRQAIASAIVNERNAGYNGKVRTNENRAGYGRGLDSGKVYVDEKGNRFQAGDTSASLGATVFGADRETGAYNAAKQSEKDLIQNLYNQAAQMRAARPAGQKNISDPVYDELVGKADRLQAIQMLKDYFNPDTNKVLYADEGGALLKNPASFDSIFNLYGSDRGEQALKGLLAGDSTEGLGNTIAGQYLSRGGDELPITPHTLEQFLRSQKLYDVLRRREKETADVGGSDNLYRSKLEEMLGYEPGKMSSSRGGDALKYGDMASILKALTGDIAAARVKAETGHAGELTQNEKKENQINAKDTTHFATQDGGRARRPFITELTYTFAPDIQADFQMTPEEAKAVFQSYGLTNNFRASLPDAFNEYVATMNSQGVGVANRQLYAKHIKPLLQRATGGSLSKEDQLYKDLKKEWATVVDNKSISEEEASEINSIIEQLGSTTDDLQKQELLASAAEKIEAAKNSRERPSEVEDEVKFVQYFEAKYAQVQDQLAEAKDEIEDTIVRLSNALQADIKGLNEGASAIAAGVDADTQNAMQDLGKAENAKEKLGKNSQLIEQFYPTESSRKAALREAASEYARAAGEIEEARDSLESTIRDSAYKGSLAYTPEEKPYIRNAQRELEQYTEKAREGYKEAEKDLQAVKDKYDQQLKSETFDSNKAWDLKDDLEEVSEKLTELTQEAVRIKEEREEKAQAHHDMIYTKEGKVRKGINYENNPKEANVAVAKIQETGAPIYNRSLIKRPDLQAEIDPLMNRKRQVGELSEEVKNTDFLPKAMKDYDGGEEERVKTTPSAISPEIEVEGSQVPATNGANSKRMTLEQIKRAVKGMTGQTSDIE